MRIVRASVLHLGDVQFLLREYYGALGIVEVDTPEEVESYLCEPASGFWLAYIDTSPVGCVALRPGPEPSTSSECKRLYVRPEARGLGIAELLLDALEAEAEARGNQ